MQFKEGATVVTSDGSDVGEIDRVVLDPMTKEVTHLVVRKGFLLTRDKVVPIDAVTTTSEERVIIQDVDDLDTLSDFEETYYIRVGDGGPQAIFPPGYVRPYYWYPPAGSTWWAAARVPNYPPPPYVQGVRRNIPAGTVPLKEGASVITADDDHVGNVERVLAEPTQDRATHLLISQGLLPKETKVVPTSWITRVAENEVHLAVTSGLIERLPEHDPNR